MNIPEHAAGTEGSGVGAGTGAQLGHRGANAAGSRWGRPDQCRVNTPGRLAPEGSWARGAEGYTEARSDPERLCLLTPA